VSVTWPLALLALLAVPLLAGAYVWQLRRKRRRAVRYSSVALIRAAAPRRAAWKRHVPVALLLAALAALGLAAARPRLSVDVPVSEAAMILALDVSGSMCATDVEPNRLTAAQTAVRDFVQGQDGDTRIGLVLFAGFAQVAVAPTTDRAALLQAIDTLTTGRGTTIGAAILKSVDAIAEINPTSPPPTPGAPRRAPHHPGPQAATHRRSSCCSPTAPTPGASSRSTRRRSPPSEGCGCTRSASERGTRRRWCARRPSSAGGASRAAAAATSAGA
jgi:Ca-activated chloride channel family protein